MRCHSFHEAYKADKKNIALYNTTACSHACILRSVSSIAKKEKKMET